MSSKHWFASLAALAIAGAIAGCPGTLDDDQKQRLRADGGGTTCEDAMPIFKASCAGSGCHNATDKYSDLDLETPGVVSRYNGVGAKGGMMHKLIDSSDPSKSAIYTKTKAPVPFGAQMPIGGTKLTDAQQQCILDWIKKELEGVGPADTGSDDTGSDDTGAADAASD